MANLSQDALKKLRAEREKLLKDGNPEDIAKAFEQISKNLPEKTREEKEYDPFQENGFRSFDPTPSDSQDKE